MRSVCFALVLVALGGCATTGTYVGPDHRDQPTPPLPDGEITHEVFLTANTADGESDVVLRALRTEMERAGELATLVFMGDQVPNGLPDSVSSMRAEAEARMDALVGAARGLEGRIVVVPGDRDWARGEEGLKAQEDYLETALDADVLTPGDQSGGPREIKLADGLRLLVLDTAWWLRNPEDRPEGEAEDVDIRSPADVAAVLEAIIADRNGDRLVVVGHHPLRSNGPRAGARTVQQTIRGFGVTALLAQTFGLSRQDLASSRYRELRSSLDHLVAEHNRLVYAAGHERNLAAFTIERSPITQQTFLSSGTGGGAADPAVQGGAEYQSSRPGYQRLVYYTDGRLWVETVEVGPTGERSVAFRTELAGVNRERVDPLVPDDIPPSQLPDELGETIEVSAEADFAKPFNNDAFTRLVFGAGYRDTWKARVDIPVLDIGAIDGGLVPVKRGGGLQTTSLRLRGDTHQYNIRLLEKSGLAQVPIALRDGAVGDVVLGLRSAQTPFGILAADPLETAAGIITSGSQIVYIPDDPRLGRYRELFAGRVALFQIRADDDMSDVPGFEGITEVVSAQKVREEMDADQDHRIDQRAYLRARLFDVLIGDWDRHSDQWRWAAFEPVELDPTLTGDEATRGKVYQPIPRDRDFAFYGFEGLIGKVMTTFIDKRLRRFNGSFGSLAGATANGFPQDRRFLNRMEEDDYVEAARELQARLTDAVIDDAVRQLPPSAYALDGERWAHDLKARRALLVDVARGLYRLQADVVDVIGSNERELFEVVHRGNQTEVAVFSYKKRERGAELYRRTFHYGETGEVRLYGFAGRDRFEISGEGGVLVRVIGGGGTDELTATSRRAQTKAYDAIGGMMVEEDQGVSRHLRDDAEVNRYDPHEYVPRDQSWLPTVGYSATDGAILGVGTTWNLPGFRLHPYGATHTVYANLATATGGLAGGYVGRMRHAFGDLDLDVEALASTPRYARNFYGIGNASNADNAIDGALARVDLARVQAEALMGGQVGQGIRFTLGPTVRYADAGLDTAQMQLAAFQMIPMREREAQLHMGGLARLAISTTDAALNPRQGLRLDAHGAYRAGVSDESESYGALGGSAAVYIPFSVSPQVTLAVRAGADHRFGDYPFYDAASLGGSDALRGYRRERFAGRTATYGNAEVRAKLFNLATYVLPFEVGALAFADGGRVWADTPTCLDIYSMEECAVIDIAFADPDGDEGLHLGYGGGLWLGALDQLLLNATVGRSSEGTLFSLGLGFQY